MSYGQGVIIEEMEETTGALPALQQSLDVAKIMQEVNQELQVRTGEAVERAFSYAEKLSRDILERVRTEIAGIGKPKIMAVKIEGVVHKLSKSASPYLPRLLINAQLGKHSLLVGPAGCGKTVVAHQLAEALGRDFGQVCFTAGASESWLFGRQTPNGFVEGSFSKLYKNGGVFLGDELDAADSNMLLAINTALANGHFYNPINGELVNKHENFVFVAAANTFGLGADGSYTGRNRLDAATLDRFVGCVIQVDYSPAIEEQVCPDEEIRTMMQGARAKLREMKAQQVLSTRALQAAYDLSRVGVGMEEIIQSITSSWPEGLATSVGLVVKKGKAKKKDKLIQDKDIF